MADYASIEVELKGVKYTTEATDSAGILFLSILFNEDETALIRQGRMEDAIALYSDRAASRMKCKLESAKSSEEKQKIEDQLNNEIIQELWQRMERSNSTRSLIAKRIKELFRFAAPNPIPERLVFWNSDEDNGINLSAADLLALFTAIVGPTLADFSKKKTESTEAEAESPLNIEQESVQQDAIAENSPIAVAAPDSPVRVSQDSLLAQQAALAKKLAEVNTQLAS